MVSVVVLPLPPAGRPNYDVCGQACSYLNNDDRSFIWPLTQTTSVPRAAGLAVRSFDALWMFPQSRAFVAGRQLIGGSPCEVP